VADVNNDGANDLIFGQGHDYGLEWLEQRKDKAGLRSWYKHTIDASASQYHTMEWADLDNDGSPELITGKRYRAHGDDDPGAADAIGMYYFKWNGKLFEKNVISYGLLGEGKEQAIILWSQIWTQMVEKILQLVERMVCSFFTMNKLAFIYTISDKRQLVARTIS
jgi:hypothetical protein